jgi:hypothetical protein
MVKRIQLAILYAVFVGGIALYVILYFDFLRDIVNAAGTAPNLDNGAVQLAAGIGGLLAGTFAVAFGIQRRDPDTDEKKLNLGRTLTPNAEFVTAVCLLVYFLVGVAATFVSLAHSDETPQEIKTPVTIFVGYLAAIFAAIVSGPGRTADT